MKNKILFLLLIIILPSIDAVISNSTNYNIYSLDFSPGGNITSLSYKNLISINALQSNISSADYSNDLGFIYTLQTVPDEEEEAAASGGGGTDDSGGAAGEGGGAVAKKKPIAISNFTIGLDLMKVTIVQGEVETAILNIVNTGDITERIRIEPPEFPVSLLFSETEFSLSPGESKTITIDISPMEDLPPKIYQININVKSNSITRVLRLIVEIKPRIALFDIRLVLPRASKEGILRGESVQADISMFNLGDLKPVDVMLEYGIMDLDGNLITKETETLAVATENAVIRRLRVPEDIEYGDYLFYAEITYDMDKAVASKLFKVVKERPSLARNYLPYIIGVGLGVVLFVVLLIIKAWNSLKQRWRHKIRSKDGRNKLRIREEQLRLEQELLFKKEKQELLKKLKTREHESLIKDKIKFKGLKSKREEKERKERERLEEKRRRLEELRKKKIIAKNERTRRLHKFLHTFGLYKTEKDKKEEERRRLRKLKEKELEKKKRLEELRKKKTIAKRERTRRSHKFLHRLGLYNTEEDKKEEKRRKLKEKELKKKRRLEEKKKKIITKNERTRRSHKFLHRLGLYNTEEDKKEEKRRKLKEKELKKKRRLEEKKKKGKKQLEFKETLRKKIFKFKSLIKKTKRYMKEKRTDKVASCYSKLKPLYNQLIAMPLETEEKEELYYRFNDIYLWVCKETYKKEQAELENERHEI